MKGCGLVPKRKSRALGRGLATFLRLLSRNLRRQPANELVCECDRQTVRRFCEAQSTQ
jgi:hypothetical protein